MRLVYNNTNIQSLSQRYNPVQPYIYFLFAHLQLGSKQKLFLGIKNIGGALAPPRSSSSYAYAS
jgi:hypothetical protein